MCQEVHCVLVKGPSCTWEIVTITSVNNDRLLQIKLSWQNESTCRGIGNRWFAMFIQKHIYFWISTDIWSKIFYNFSKQFMKMDTSFRSYMVLSGHIGRGKFLYELMMITLYCGSVWSTLSSVLQYKEHSGVWWSLVGVGPMNDATSNTVKKITHMSSYFL